MELDQRVPLLDSVYQLDRVDGCQRKSRNQMELHDIQLDHLNLLDSTFSHDKVPQIGHEVHQHLNTLYQVDSIDPLDKGQVSSLDS